MNGFQFPTFERIRVPLSPPMDSAAKEQLDGSVSTYLNDRNGPIICVNRSKILTKSKPVISSTKFIFQNFEKWINC